MQRKVESGAEFVAGISDFIVVQLWNPGPRLLPLARRDGANRPGITLAEILLGVLSLGIGSWSLARALTCVRPAEPDFAGAEWLASPTWAEFRAAMNPDPGLFNGPVLTDGNGPGTELGRYYGGMSDESVAAYLAARQERRAEGSLLHRWLRSLLGERGPHVVPGNLFALRN